MPPGQLGRGPPPARATTGRASAAAFAAPSVCTTTHAQRAARGALAGRRQSTSPPAAEPRLFARPLGNSSPSGSRLPTSGCAQALRPPDLLMHSSLWRIASRCVPRRLRVPGQTLSCSASTPGQQGCPGATGQRRGRTFRLGHDCGACGPCRASLEPYGGASQGSLARNLPTPWRVSSGQAGP